MLSAVDGHVCNLAVNGPCIYIGPTATDVVQYIDVDILVEVSTLARLKAGHGDELTWQLMLLVTASAMLSQISQNLDTQDVTRINVQIYCSLGLDFGGQFFAQQASLQRKIISKSHSLSPCFGSFFHFPS